MSKHFGVTAFAVLLTAHSAALGQVGVGYGGKSPMIGVAPGQLVTLFADSNGVQLQQPYRADSFPLPIHIEEFGAFANYFNFAESLPVFSVRHVDSGDVAVTIQVPFYDEERFPYSIGMLHPGGNSNCGHLGRCEAPQEIVRVRSAIHILRTCDSVFLEPTVGCEPLVTHSDGLPVADYHRPRPGEILTAYAVGLGAPPGMDDSKPFNEFDDVVVLQENCPTAFVKPPHPEAPGAEFAALLHPSVGLYQINFKVLPATDDESCASPLFGPQFTIGRVIDGLPDSFDVFQLPPLAAPL